MEPQLGEIEALGEPRAWTAIDRPKGLQSVWTRYMLRMTFVNNLCASVPASPKLIKAWLDARKPAVRPPGGKSIDDINEEVLARLAKGEGEAPQEFNKLVFERDPSGDRALVVRAATVRAHTKEAARVLSTEHIGVIEGEKRFSTRVINGVYFDIRHELLAIRRPDGTVVTEPDGELEKPVHFSTAQGPRSALKCFDFVKPPSMIEITLFVLASPVKRKTKKKAVEGEAPEPEPEPEAKPSVSVADLFKIYEYGGTHGYGGERGAGQGRYTFELFKEER